MKTDLYFIPLLKQRISACFTELPVFPANAIRFIRASLSRLNVVMFPRLVFRQGYQIAKVIK